MRRSRLVAALLVGVVGLGAAGLAVAGSQRNHSVHLKSAFEVPVNGSKGQGQAIFKLAKDGESLDYKLIVANIDGVTQAHIHCGSPAVNGPIVVFLFGFDPAGVTTNGVLSEGTVADAQVIARPSSAECPGGVATLADVVAKIASGEAYVNVHTLELPGGEIRGNF